MISEALRNRLATAYRSGVSLHAIARVTQIHVSTLSRVVSGQRQLTRRQIDALAEYFNLQVVPRMPRG